MYFYLYVHFLHPPTYCPCLGVDEGLSPCHTTESLPSSELSTKSLYLNAETHPQTSSLPQYDRVAAGVSVVLFFSISFVLSVFET